MNKFTKTGDCYGKVKISNGKALVLQNDSVEKRNHGQRREILGWIGQMFQQWLRLLHNV